MDINNSLYKDRISTFLKKELKNINIDKEVYDCTYMSVQVAIVYIINSLIEVLKKNKSKKVTKEMLKKLKCNSDIKKELLNSKCKINVDFSDMIFDLYIYLIKDGKISKHVINRINITINSYLTKMSGTIKSHFKEDNLTEGDATKIINYAFPSELLDVINEVSFSEVPPNSDNESSESSYKYEKNELFTGTVNKIDENSSEDIFDMIDIDKLQKKNHTNSIHEEDEPMINIISTFTY